MEKIGANGRLDGKKILVSYYSKGGNTRRVAEQLSKRSHALWVNRNE